MSEKIAGYLLLLVGLVAIALASFNVYQVFTKQSRPMALFELKGVSIDISQYLPSDPLRTPSTTPPAELFPASDLNLISNLTAHYLLMSFFIGVGAKVSSLGISLLRPIEVKVDKSRVVEVIRAMEPKSASAPGSSAKS